MNQQKQLSHPPRAAVEAHHPLFEPLEDRRLLAFSPVVMDVRLPGGGHSATVTNVGDVVNFEVWATVTGTDNNPANDGFQEVTGSLRSDNVIAGSALGTLQLTPAAPFDALGSSSGTQQDLDGDTDLDVGSNNATSANGFFAVRAAAIETSGTVVGSNSQSFKIATGTFTVTSLLSGVSTNLIWNVRQANAGFVYQVDGQRADPLTAGSVVAGQGIVLKRPGAATINGRVFNDTNADGIFDGADTPIDNFRVFLDSNANGILDSGELSKPVSTAGTYNFTGVVAGTYRVREVFRTGWRQSFPGSGFYDVTVGYGQMVRNRSFANTDTVIIKGKVWADFNVNKFIDEVEPGLAKWVLFLDNNDNGRYDRGEQFDITDARGNYRFFNLPAGTYNVRIAQISTWRLTTPTSGVRTLTLAAGQTTSNKNFGEKRLK